MNALKHYLPAIRKYKWWIVAMIIGNLIGDLAFLAYPLYIREIADLFAGSFEQNYPQALYFFKIILALWAVEFIFKRIFWYSIMNFECKAMRYLNERCFRAIQNHSFHFFANSFTGSLVKKVSRFVRSLESITDNIFFNFFQNIVHIAFIMLIFFLEKPFFGFIFLAWAIVFLVGNYIFALWKLKYDKIAAKADSKISGALADSFSNYSTVKIFAAEKKEQKRFKKTTQDWKTKTYKSWFLSFKFDLFQILLMMTLEGVLLFLSMQWWKNNTFTVGDLLLFQTYLIATFQQLWSFGRNVRNFYRDLANAQEMADIFEKDLEIKDASNAQILKINKGEIEFKNVSFCHHDGNNDVLTNFSLHIKPREKVALVGHSGAGKTTIASLLFRFFDIQKGQILIDGQNIAKVTQESLRHNISLVPQDPNLFHRSIAENIAYAKNLKDLPGLCGDLDTQIIQAAKKAKAHDFIKKLANGYDTFVGERGIKLSGGERQRIAIARIILENSKILVFDEATSALDSSTEKEIQIAMEKVMQDKTTIIIAHRLSTVKKVDRVIVIDDGKIIEQGKHDELIKKSGKYAELWSHQVGGFLADE